MTNKTLDQLSAVTPPPVDTDILPILRQSSGVLTSITWLQIKTAMQAFVSTLFLQAANNLSDLASAATARMNLGLGTAATQSTGTSGATVPLLSGTNTWANVQTFTNGLTATNDITVNRSSASTTGYVFFGNTGTHYIGCDGTNVVVGGSGTLNAPSGGFSGALTGNVTGNVSGSSGSCTGNAATATALTAGNKTIAGALAINGALTVQSDPNFGLHSAAGQYVLQLGASNGINFDTGTGRLNIVIGGVTVNYFDSGGIH